MDTNLLDRITTNSGLFNGKPIIRGMRFKVADFPGYLSSGMTAEEIPAALLYAQKKVDHSIITF